jgi:hypothetical protein
MKLQGEMRAQAAQEAQAVYQKALGSVREEEPDE